MKGSHELIMEEIDYQIKGLDNPHASRSYAKSLLTDIPNRNTIEIAIKSLLPPDIDSLINNGTLGRVVNNVIHNMKEKYSIYIKVVKNLKNLENIENQTELHEAKNK